MAAAKWPVHGTITGPIVIIGFGSIGRGTLPLLERHFKFDKSRVVVIDPRDSAKPPSWKKCGIRFIRSPVTHANYRELLNPLLTEGGGQGFCINLSVDTSSLDIMRLSRELGALYIDTVIEPWEGFLFRQIHRQCRPHQLCAARNPAGKEAKKHPGGTTAVSCCGANPGMVSWFVKQALLNLAADLKIEAVQPANDDSDGWAKLMRKLGVKGIHISERDTQRAKKPKPFEVFWNTWSVEGFISEGLQPAELGWGTHEKWMPKNARKQKKGCKAAIFLEQPGADTRVRTWCPTPGAQYGFLVTHNEAVSVADFFTVWSKRGKVKYRPTCHYAYHPCNDALLSLDEMFGRAGIPQKVQHVLDEDELEDGRDELGVLLYGHKKNAYWFGSNLTIDEARKLAPYQNATGMQVTSAVIAGMVWALENPEAGIVESDEMDHRRCLDIQTPYLGTLRGLYTDWTPLKDRPGLFEEDLDLEDPWQFRNILVR